MGVDAWLSDHAFQMEISAPLEPTAWLMMTLGFAGFGFFAHRAAGRPASA
jgi:hypothetical protein